MKKIFVVTCLFVSLFLKISAQDFGHVVDINKGWSFKLGDEKYGGMEFLDDSKWEKVKIPHDWSILQNPSKDNSSCTGFYPGGIGYYRRMLDIPADRKGQKVYVYFGGVYNKSEVFINGKWIGKKYNGFIPFMYDLTPYINFGGRNVLAVRVDHSEDADCRWYTGSGIYRDVSLIYANPIHIALWGVHFTAEVKEDKATILVNTEVKNTTNKEAKIEVLNELYSKDGKKVASSKSILNINSKSENVSENKMYLNDPMLWNLENPYLYTLKTSIFLDGKKLDNSKIRVGIRTIKFDSNSGFSLNGKNMKLKGVCLHSDLGALGVAFHKDVLRTRLQAIKDMGSNAVRASHNCNDVAFYDLCDEMGLLVKDEAFDEWEYPKKKWIEGWNHGKPGLQGSSAYFREYGKDDLRSMVKANRNHPSIIMWSIGNEIDYPNDPYSHPILDREGIGQPHESKYQKGRPHARTLGKIAKELVGIVKEVDTTRPVTAALAGAVMSNETEYPEVLDVVGYNYTEGRYEMDHKKYPDRIFFGSENGNNYDAWKHVRDKDYIMGQFLWVGISYLGEAGPWPARGGFNSSTIDAIGNRKTRGDFRASLWLTEPYVYLGSHREKDSFDTQRKRKKFIFDVTSPYWNYESGEVVNVEVFTNGDSAELFLNGKLVGEKKSYDDNIGAIQWKIPYQEGELEAKIYKDGKSFVSKKIKTVGRPYKIEAELVKGDLNDRNPMYQLKIGIFDDKGNFLVKADNNIKCEVMGNAKLVALDSAKNDVSQSTRDNVHSAYNGSLLAYIEPTSEKGEVEVILTSEGLKPFSIKFDL